MKYLCVVFLIVTVSPMFCHAQERGISLDGESKSRLGRVEAVPVGRAVKDSMQLAKEARSQRAWKRSLIVPGWGQYTNGGRWWLKVPVIYGGFVAGVLMYDYNQAYYKEYLSEAQYRIENHDAPPPWSPYQHRRDLAFTNNVIAAKDHARRNRDLTALVMVGWWALNAVEAYTSDMLRNRWNVGEDLSATVAPAVIPFPVPGGYSPMLGLKLQMSIGAE